MSEIGRATSLAALIVACAGGCAAPQSERASTPRAVDHGDACVCPGDCECTELGEPCDCDTSLDQDACECGAGGACACGPEGCACAATGAQAGGGATLEGQLARPLTPAAAVGIALLASSELADTYTELGIEPAGVMASGLLEMSLGVGDGPAPSEQAVVQEFLRVLVPVGRASAEPAAQQLAQRVAAVAAAVRTLYYDALAADQIARVSEAIAEVGQAAADLAVRLHEAGNINDLEFARRAAACEEQRVDALRARFTAGDAREALARRLGPPGLAGAFSLPEELPPLPAEDVAFDELAKRALDERQDLQELRRDVDLLTQVLPARQPAATGAPAPAYERLGAAERRLAALEQEALADLRAAHARVVAARAIAAQQGELVVPLRARIVELTQEHYDYMLLGAFDLLAAKQDELRARADLAAAVGEYVSALIELERLSGGGALATLTPAAPPAAPPPSAASQAGGTGHHGHH